MLFSHGALEGVGYPLSPRYFLYPRLIAGKEILPYKRGWGPFHPIMNSTVSHPMLEREEEEELLVEFEHFERNLKVNEILKEVKSELSFLKDDSVDEFAEQLKQEKQNKPLRAVHIHPQFTCDWYIEGLDFVAPGWRNEFQRPLTPPPLRKTKN